MQDVYLFLNSSLFNIFSFLDTIYIIGELSLLKTLILIILLKSMLKFVGFIRKYGVYE